MTEAREELAPYAATAARSRGRRHSEPPPTLRTEFQRDRDRVIHSTAFRRLVYKTQVFVNYEGDLYRTRLTHSLEVAQIARTVARALNLNEDLVEAISLAHDLGHTPFGHAGQDALNECMREHGGFEHNLQSLRVVDLLEDRYAAFCGINLTFETREGILKHCSLKHARQLGDVGRRFLDRTQPGLEAQLANIADEIAYNNHDVDDGLRSGLVTLEQLATLPFFEDGLRRIRREHPKLKPQLQGSELVREMIGQLVADLVTASAAEIAAAAPRDIDEVRALPHGLIELSAPVRESQVLLKRFLRDSLYMHPRVQQMTAQARDTVRFLFESLTADYDRMPDEHAASAKGLAAAGDEAGAARVVADYIAGMTDRFALQTRDSLRAGR
ncbi:MAG TPA: deoxyguanosinetriphosphate triphosphohydrolase [Gammaproteobacteria bacterium]|nr:deoxyguanosinetriphosphate triphosphohydrolase [Gammaproteobacteria bacterium]